ncbi:hypothetical protein ACWA5Z_06585 [Testudinibacter sp. P80/BLE/0925]
MLAAKELSELTPMQKAQLYEAMKRKLQAQNLSPKQYEQRIKIITRELGL